MGSSSSICSGKISDVDDCMERLEQDTQEIRVDINDDEEMSNSNFGNSGNTCFNVRPDVRHCDECLILFESEDDNVKLDGEVNICRSCFSSIIFECYSKQSVHEDKMHSSRLYANFEKKKVEEYKKMDRRLFILDEKFFKERKFVEFVIMKSPFIYHHFIGYQTCRGRICEHKEPWKCFMAVHKYKTNCTIRRTTIKAVRDFQRKSVLLRKSIYKVRHGLSAFSHTIRSKPLICKLIFGGASSWLKPDTDEVVEKRLEELLSIAGGNDSELENISNDHYNFFSDNCEDFCRFILFGERWSGYTKAFRDKYEEAKLHYDSRLKSDQVKDLVDHRSFVVDAVASGTGVGVSSVVKAMIQGAASETDELAKITLPIIAEKCTELAGKEVVVSTAGVLNNGLRGAAFSGAFSGVGYLVVATPIEGGFLLYRLVRNNEIAKLETRKSENTILVSRCVGKIACGTYGTFAGASLGTALGTMAFPGAGTVVGFFCGFAGGLVGGFLLSNVGDVASEIIGIEISKSKNYR